MAGNPLEELGQRKISAENFFSAIDEFTKNHHHEWWHDDIKNHAVHGHQFLAAHEALCNLAQRYLDDRPMDDLTFLRAQWQNKPHDILLVMNYGKTLDIITEQLKANEKLQNPSAPGGNPAERWLEAVQEIKEVFDQKNIREHLTAAIPNLKSAENYRYQ